ncbi:hypothetical protein DRE_00128 [Drechslerella stenobrocha 248]|uniref:FAS1 domain-containing protein n=1 Tax=Drechslerella stenobrocha 248 TaxID=1043628 RepID=W7I930_9PEZI|nr:hypothetical protein DRE_00128 [Drechslerella stenobrocha 248]
MYRHLASECPAHDQAEGGGDNPQWPEPPEPPEPPSWPPKPPGDEPRPRPPAHPGKPPGHPQHPPPHHSRPHIHNETIWQLISKSNYTKKFAEYVAEFEDLVTLLNSTVANYTVFVPTDRAFDNVEKHIHNKHPSKEKIKQALTYHITNEPFPIFKLLLSHTIPSALHSDQLGGPQRLRIGLGPHGFAVNFYSHIVAGNIFASNGVIHGVDNILIPPPDVEVILSLFPTQFSTFSLAAHLTNLKADLPAVTRGGTLFAPPNSAWERLPRKVNAFLFSPFGRKYLKALLQYHVVLNETLYSDAYYHPIAQEGEVQSLPKGQYHVDLPTLLEGKHLSIDISRFGGFINIVINGQSVVRVQDGIARNGVIQVVKNVLIPPRKPPADPVEAARREMEDIEIQHGIGEMTLEDFKSRFEGLLED